MANWYIWYVTRENETAGPFTKEQIEEQVAQGQLKAADLIRKEDEESFTRASLIPGLIPELETENQPSAVTRLLKKITLKRVVITFLAGVTTAVLLVVLIPYILYQIDLSHRLGSRNNIQRFGLAIHNYNASRNIMPPGGVFTPTGDPHHGWQSFILPFLKTDLPVEEMTPVRIYNRINFDLPWNNISNTPRFKHEIAEYLVPGVGETVSPEGLALSHYVGNEYVMVETGTQTGREQMRFHDITDGIAFTIFAMETGEQFKPWGDPTNTAKPIDLIGTNKPSPFIGGNHVMLGDGRVRFISNQIDPKLLQALSTPDGGENLEDY
ncbi:MAG: hypothetical protein CME31_01635 [Gimesia sp.]|jgi:hypothetical protein|uniref:Uncharacterized protein n=1 Tax=Gimesia maris TaxID=122 RepID=A0A3D3RFB7_9PLAN|nr:hypothetical protein [Gimesia sp.]HCO27505.1 hypothetical protein [Gimesia maris]|tara:strand:+ start:104489 stop:105460 length:972 start_codon:yes stop_codon:yes gene_type:complete